MTQSAMKKGWLGTKTDRWRAPSARSSAASECGLGSSSMDPSSAWPVARSLVATPCSAGSRWRRGAVAKIAWYRTKHGSKQR